MAQDETFDERDLEAPFNPDDDFAHLLDTGHLSPPAEGELLEGHEGGLS